MTSPEQPLDWAPRSTPLGQPAAPVTGPAGYPPAYGPPPPSYGSRRRHLIIGLSVAIAVALLAVGGTITALALRGQQVALAGPSPTCDVIGANGCTTKGSDGGPVAAPSTAPTSSAPPAPPPPPPPPAVPTIEEGTWTVGADVPPGTYRTTGTAGDSCYWSITKSGSNGENILSNHIGGGRLTVVLKNGQDFETARCGTWTKVG